MKKYFLAAVAASFCAIASSGSAQASDVSSFFDTFKTFSADFSQVAKQDNAIVQRSSGSVKLKKPSKFVWDYQAPNAMILSSDGEKFYHYDVDLAQVTVKPVNEVTNSALTALLSGRDKLDDVFTIQSFGAPAVKKMFPSQADAWIASADIFYELIPRRPPQVDGDPQRIVVGLSANQQLRVLYAEDDFGDNTFIFSRVQQNKALSDKVFTFQAPRGVDVLGE